MIKETNFAKSISSFLLIFLPGQRNASANTIKSYRDSLKQLIVFINVSKKISAENIAFSDINRNLILDFLKWLEEIQNVSIS